MAFKSPPSTRASAPYEAPKVFVVGPADRLTLGGHHGAASDGVGFAFHASL
jgi:hypothetical protein